MRERELGVGLAGTLAPADMGDFAEAVEGLGFDVLSVFGDLGYQPPFLPLLTAASRTSRLRLGPACVNPYTTHPFEIAGQLAYLAAASGGRAYLGLARGAWLERIGVAQPRPLSALREAATIVRQLLAGDSSGVAGRVFSVAAGAQLEQPLPARPVPLLLGGWGPRLTRLAGEIADEQKLGGTANPDFVALAASRLRGSATRIVVGAVTVIDRDGALARRVARRFAAPYVEVVGALDETFAVDPDLLSRLRVLLGAGDADGAGMLLPDAVVDRFALAGTPTEVAEHVEALFAAGATRVEFGPPLGLGDRTQGLRVLASALAPT